MSDSEEFVASEITKSITSNNNNNNKSDPPHFDNVINLVPKIRGFKIASLNITSLPKHIDELRIYMFSKDVDVLAINESRMDSSVPTGLIAIPGYTWVSKDRNRFGGGIGFFIRDTVNFRLRPDLGSDDIEILTIEIRKYKIKPFLITTWYRSPSDSIDTLHKFEKTLQLIDADEKESIIVGDFNCDLLASNKTDSLKSELNFTTKLYQYEQIITKQPESLMSRKL